MKTLLAAVLLLLLPVCCMAQSAPASPVYLIQSILHSTGFTIVVTGLMIAGVAVFAATQSFALLISVVAFVVFADVVLPLMADVAGQNFEYASAPREEIAPTADTVPDTTVIAVSPEGRPSAVVARRGAPVVTPVPTIEVQTFALPEEKPEPSSSIGTTVLSILGVLVAAVVVLVGGAFAWSRGKTHALYAVKHLKPSKAVNTGYTPRSAKLSNVAAAPGVQSGFTPARPRPLAPSSSRRFTPASPRP